MRPSPTLVLSSESRITGSNSGASHCLVRVGDIEKFEPHTMRQADFRMPPSFGGVAEDRVNTSGLPVTDRQVLGAAIRAAQPVKYGCLIQQDH